MFSYYAKLKGKIRQACTQLKTRGLFENSSGHVNTVYN